MKHFPRLSRDAELRLPFPTAEAPRIAGPRVEILLRLFDGVATVADDLAEVARQTHPDWSLSIRDDGSRDDGPELVRRFARAHPRHRIRIWSGAHKGPSRSVLALLAESDPSSDFIAWRREGSIWNADVLSRALERLAGLPPGVPALFCATAARHWPRKARLRRPPGFRNALVEGPASAGVLVANRAAAAILRTAAAYRGPVPHPAWWTYQVVTGAGGTVILDDRPLRLRRPAPRARLPAAPGLAALAGGRFASWTDQNIAALMAISPLLTRRSRKALMDLAELRALPAAARLRRFGASGLYRQTRAGQAALWAAVAAGRV